MKTRTFLMLSLSVFLGACPEPEPPPVAEGIFAPLGEIMPRATEEQRDTFARGEAVARMRFTPEMGLGPEFNVTFCGACHEKPVFGGSAGRYRNFLLVEQRLSDGSASNVGKNGVQVHFDSDGTRVPTAEGANNFALRNPIPFFGVGLLAEIPEEAILANADPDDANNDGISGRPNIDRGFVGRFGRKAQTVSIEGFIRGPLGNHLGITSNPLSEELRALLPVASPRFDRDLGSRSDGLIGGVSQAQASAPDEPIEDSDDVPDPELSNQDLFDLVSWAMLLAAPEPEPLNEMGMRGSALFDEAQCSACHVRGLEGPDGLVPAFSDLLLHDMGEQLADGVDVMAEASGSEFRTQPLWGIAPVGPYLHDGRADTLDEAIRWHGGEAARARTSYEGMSDEDRAALIEFLMSLGGRSQFTPGLIPTDAPVPTEGAGAPLPLDAEGMEHFVFGRELFDRDAFLSEGLGPVFNGDSCRACHFDPVPGGSGPAGVDVVRHGRWDGSAFTAPSFGTISHRHGAEPIRPRYAEDANFVELRQTPTLLGLGLLERIPEAQIMAFADPDDLDGDGVRGTVHTLPDGRVGRLGWKADVPSVHEFVRDALSAELGRTLPDEEGFTYGRASDDDTTPDPETSLEEIEGITFFIANLAPPVPQSEDPAMEEEGAALFTSMGCNSCHRVMTLEDGTEVRAYTDLLLHDVAAEDYLGMPSFNAPPRMFRTAPLWGVRDTAPYMHDGLAQTLEAAIAMHFTEAEQARLAYESASAEEREALLAFLASL